MSKRLRQFLHEAYAGHEQAVFPYTRRLAVVQIDYQDDNDSLDEFCNVFVSIGKNESFDVELSGRIPISDAMVDLAEIYGGFADRNGGRLVLRLNPDRIDALEDLAAKLKATAHLGSQAGNPAWDSISARTVSSLRRFIRLIRDFRKER
jgi:hypothetical protein